MLVLTRGAEGHSVSCSAPCATKKMKLAVVCVLAAALAGGSAGDLLDPERSYNILVLLPVASKSHQNVFRPVVEALADRGHKLVVLTGFPMSFKHPAVMEVSHDLPYAGHRNRSMFDSRKKSAAGFDRFTTTLPAIARDLYKVPKVKELYEQRKNFDLIIVNHMFNEVAYPFVHEVPFITVATPGMDFRQSAVFGNVLNPSYVPNLLLSFPFPMSVWDRFKNMVIHIVFSIYWRSWAVVPLVQKEISAQFPDLPPLLELERNQSLALLNTHFSIDTVVPLLPSQVEVGAMHCRPAKPLPEDIELWITGAGPAGVIYFSLGSIARGDTMPPEYREAFLEAFRRLPQRVLWKYEGELEGAPDNVKLSSWMPQQDILAHDNVKVFITHGGLLSTQESLYHGTPLLTLPIFGDQPKNGMLVENSGLGHMLVWEELTPDMIVNVLTDIINNPKYKENVERMSRSLRDQLTTPQERAVFWTEYVIRHRGAPQLRSPAAQLSWVEFLLLDVLALLLMSLLVLLFILRRILQTICSKVFSSARNKKKRD